MTWFVAALVVVLLVLTTAAVLGRVDGSIAEPTSSLAHEPLPDGPLRARDLDELRFDTGLRGYRMAQVDRVVDRLRREVEELQDEVQRLRAERATSPTTTPTTPSTPEED